MKHKKSFIMTDALIYIILALFVFLVLVFIVPKLLGGGAKETKDLLSSTRDYDNDGVSDFFDKCVCEYGEDNGCPIGKITDTTSPDQKSGFKYERCPEGKAPKYDEKSKSTKT